MILGLLSTRRSMYPIPAIAIKLLIVKLTIMAANAGKTLRASGGVRKGKNIARYPPTRKPTGKDPKKHAMNRCLLSKRIMLAAIKLARGPSMTS